MKQYSTYKDSGIEWIGQIPEHWKAIRLKHMVEVKITDGPHETPEFIEEGGVPFLSAEAIQGNVLSIKHKRGNITREQHEIYAKKSKVLKEDTLFCKSGSTTGKSAFVETDEEFGIWSPLAIIRSQTHYDKRYVYYCIQSEHFRLQVETSWTFGTQPNIGMGALENLWVSISSNKLEQTTIANYLDRKTAEIDTLIEQKKQLIVLYKEERTATINHAVTKGLDPNVPMKDSGFDWVGKIPEHWEVKKLKYVTNLKSGDNIVSEQISKSGKYPVYGGNGLRGYFDDFTHSGDFVLIGRQGALCGNINYAHGDFWASEHAVVCSILSSHNFVWLGNLLEVMNLNQYSQSSAQPGLAVEKIKNLHIPAPSEIESQEIGEFIDDLKRKADHITSKTEKEIDLLEEYKTTLISEVVLGKVDVREEEVVA